jgi:hypothetical protein
VQECDDGALAVAVPLDESQWQRGVQVELHRGARSERWGVFVNKRAVTLRATADALDVFAPVLVARTVECCTASHVVLTPRRWFCFACSRRKQCSPS